MAKGFYVTIIRDDGKVGWLLGPYPSGPEARQHVGRACAKAEEIDPRVHWYAHGVTALELADDRPPPPGVLNKYIGLDGEIAA